jgi:DNA-binding XRE family transcriptional regulator
VHLYCMLAAYFPRCGRCPPQLGCVPSLQCPGTILDSFTVPQRVLDGDFAGWLRDEMASRHMSMRMLAVRAGVDHTTIYRLATGERQPTLATAVAIIRVLAPGPANGPFAEEARNDGPEAVEAETGRRALP